jgi:hypothetical protein
VDGDDRSQTNEIPSFDAFDRALATVVVACDQLTAATWDRDIVRAELAARAGVASWLQARAYLRRLEPSGFRGPRWRIAAFALAANRRATCEALERTRRILADSSLQRVLEHLAQTMVAANAERMRPTSAEPAG